jgi:DNA-binding NtrC family response regulator
MEQWHIHVLSLATEQQRQQLLTELKVLGCTFQAMTLEQADVACQASTGGLTLLQLGNIDVVSNQLIHQLVQSAAIFDLLLCPHTTLQQFPELHQIALEACFLPPPAAEFCLRLKHAAGLHCSKPDAMSYDPLTDELLQLNLIGRSPTFMYAMHRLRKIAATNATVLISGETGTGKELAAKAIHYSGQRSGNPFQAINCGSLPEQLIENELFGHSKGAYTDARSSQPGLIKLAEGGTLFLDEIDALPLKAQTTLLRFLQDHEYRPLGSGHTFQSDVRIIAASNTSLKQQVSEGSFRQDLYYRINLLNLTLPPLRARGDDIILLAEHFLKTCKAEYKDTDKRLHNSCRTRLLRYHWPGNVRELQNFVYKAYLLTDGPLIVSDPDDSHEVDADLISIDCTAVQCNYSEAKQQAINEFERRYLTELLSRSMGNVTRAAKLAGKERRALGKLLKKHAIERDDFLPAG